MSETNLDFLINLYTESAIPVIISDLKFNIVWENNNFSKVYELSDKADLIEILGKKPLKSDLYYNRSQNNIYTYNVTVNKNIGYIIAEQIKNDEINKLLYSPNIRKYLEYICSKVRNAVSSVTIALDGIYSSLINSNFNGNNNFEYLNIIDENMLELLSEIINPELMMSFDLEDINQEKTIYVSGIMQKITRDTQKMLGKDIKVYSDIPEGVYAHVNKKAFDVIMADLVHKCLDSETFPNEILLQLKRLSNNSIRISISANTSLSDDGIKNKAYTKDCEGQFKRNLFFDYVCDSFCEKYKGEFTTLTKINEVDDVNEVCYRLDMPAIPDNKLEISMSTSYENANSRFSPISIKLNRYSVLKNYESEISLIH